MNRKVTKRLYAGLCLGFGLMACTQDLEQERYKDLVIGLESSEINLYPLGETIRFSVYPTDMWELDIYDRPDGVQILKEGNTVRLVADPNFLDQREGSFDLTYANHNKTINLFQDPVIFNISDKDDNTVQYGDEVEVQGGEIPFDINSNVNFRIYSSREDFQIKDQTSTSFIVDASSSPAKNGDDISGYVYVDLYDKSGNTREVQNHYMFTVLQKAFLFKWTDTDPEDQESAREFSVTFNDRDQQIFSFTSSGDWKLNKENAAWLDVVESSGKEILKGGAGDFQLFLSAKEKNEDRMNPRKGRIEIVCDAYKNDPLVINLLQGKAPERGLKDYSMEIKEGGSEYLEVSVDVDDYDVEWCVIEGSDIISLSDQSKEKVKIEAVKEGKARVSAKITVEDTSEIFYCDVTVYREYSNDDDGREEIGDDEGEW